MSIVRRGTAAAALVVIGSAIIEAAIVLMRNAPSSGLSGALWPALFMMNAAGLSLGVLWLVLLPGPLLRFRSLVAALAASLLACCVLLFWASDWIAGTVMSTDTLLLLVGSPWHSMRHLLQTDLMLSLALVAALAAVCVFAFGLTGWIRVVADVGKARVIGLLAILLAAALVLQIRLAVENAGLQLASYAAVIGDSQQPAAETAFCGELQMLAPIQDVIAAAPDEARRPVIVLLVESLRGDLLTESAQAAPFLANFARENVVFDKAYATASHSDFTDLAFWYSRYPLRFARRVGYPPDAAWRGLSSFEYFKKQGYRTAYFSSQNERWGDMLNWLKLPEVDTFFHSEDFVGPTWENEDDDNGLIRLMRAGIASAGKVEDTHTLARARSWIEQHASEPFFIGLNLQNTHYSYVMPEGAQEPFQPSELGFRRVYASWPRENARNVRNRYLNAVWNLDRALARFAADLKQLGVWDRAIVLVVGDNGEAFYEHDFGNHSGPMYDEVGRTLVLAKLPPDVAAAGSHYAAPISHIDLIPLAVAAAGLPEWQGFQGVDPFAQSGARSVFMTVNAIVKEHGVVAWPWKLLKREFPQRSVELFNLEEDPRETDNAAFRNPAEAIRLGNDLAYWQSCQFRYYADVAIHGKFNPPRYEKLGR